MSVDVYKNMLRPLLFRFDPERVHQLAKLSLKQEFFWRMLQPTLNIDDARLNVQLGGLILNNPIGLSAGFDKDCEVLNGLQHLGFGYIVPGSVMPHPRSGNPTHRPRIVRYPERESMVNCLGLPSRGLAYAVDQLRRRRPGRVPVIVNFGANTLEEYVLCFEQLQPWADAIEINLRCPNARDDDGDFLRPRMFERLLEQVMKRKEKPLFVKLQTINSEQDEQDRLDLVERGLHYGVDGYTVPGTWSVAEKRLSVGKGNLSGRIVFQKTLESVRSLYEVVGNRAAIKARGGVFTGDDAFQLIAAGASSVDILTAFIYEGWSVARNINSRLLDLLDEHEIPSVTALRGSAFATMDQQTEESAARAEPGA